MLDKHSEERLALVHPALASRVRTMADMLAAENIEIRVTQGLRSWNEQKMLWDKGRDAAGKIVDESKVVTMAAPGHSWHNLALAVDVVPMVDGIPDWNPNHPIWKRIVQVGWAVGLDSGSKWRSFPDWPHFQMPGIPVSPTDEDRQTFLEAGQKGVWDKYGIDA